VIRRLFNIASAASLLLWVTATALWLRSYHAQDQLQYGNDLTHYWSDDTALILDSLSGELVLTTYRFRPSTTARSPFQPGWHYDSRDLPSSPVQADRGAAALQSALRGVPAPSPRQWFTRARWAFPHWLLSAATSALPAAWLTITRRSHKRPSGTCPVCGYDLRATPNRCPECGTVPPPPLRAKIRQQHPDGAVT